MPHSDPPQTIFIVPVSEDPLEVYTQGVLDAFELVHRNIEWINGEIYDPTDIISDSFSILTNIIERASLATLEEREKRALHNKD